MAVFPVIIVWLASLVGVIMITPLTAGWIGCALICGMLGVMIFMSMVLAGSFDEFTWWLFFPGIIGTACSVVLFAVDLTVPFWRGLGIHEVIVR